MPESFDRVWRLQGATNFRDLGGYRGLDGRAVRWRRLFRSEHLAGLTASDHAALARIGLSRSVDFRGPAERAGTPYHVPGVTQHALSIEPTVVQQMQALVQAGQHLDAPLAAGLMRDLYRALVNDNADRFAELFALLLDADDTPLVFHCTAGKDRTGLAAALILSALGVARTVVVEDYLLTNQHYRHPPLPSSDTPPEVLAVLWRVQQDFLDTALAAIDHDQGGMGRYLQHRLGLGPAALGRLAERYLEPPG
jgi:protein-tyrosine phosphatase